MAETIGTAYVQIQPSFDGVVPQIDKAMGGAGTSGGKSFGAGFAKVLGGTGALVAGAVAAGTAAVAGFAKASIDAGSTFDTSMSQVAATMGKTVDEISELRDFAQEMGSTTAFSATEAADALNYMALAGYDAETAMNMLPNVLNLAAAGSIDLASASDMITDAQTALGLSLDETKTMVDQMAKASSKSNTSVQQMGEAILTAGANAKSLSGGTTELSTVLGVLADNGIKGTDAGIRLRNIMLAMNPTTDKAAAAWEQLGVQAYDAEGNLRDLPSVFSELSYAMKDFTDQERDETISAMFNKTDSAAIKALLDTTTGRWDELTAAIEDADGAAEKMAATQLDNLEGDVTLFKSALEGAQIAVSDQLTPSLREFVQFGSDGLSTLTEAFKSGGITGAMGAFGTILADGLNMIVSQLPSAVNAGMQLVGALGQGLLSNLPIIVDAAVQIVGQLAQGILTAIPYLADGALQIVSGLADGIGQLLPTLIPAVVQMVGFLVSAISQNIPGLIDGGIQIIQGLIDGLVQGIPLLLGQIPIMIQSIANGVITAIPVLVQGAIQLMNGLIAALPTIIQALITAIPLIMSQLVTAIITAAPLLVQGAIQLVTALIENMPTIITMLIEYIPQIIVAVVNAIIAAGPQLIAAVGQILTMLLNFVVTQGANFITSAGTIMSNILTTVATWLAQLPVKAAYYVGLMVAKFITFLSQLPGKAVEQFNKLISNLVSFGNKFITQGPKIASEFGSKLINGLKELPSKMIEIGGNIIDGLKEGISKAWDSLTGWVGDLVGNLVKGFTDGLEIGSPSKVMANEVGRWIPAGIAEGIKSGMGVLDSTISAMTGEMVTTSVNPNVVGGSFYSPEDGGGNNALYNLLAQYLPQIASNENVNITLEGDAGRLFRVMQQQAARNAQLVGT